jgi:transposase
MLREMGEQLSLFDILDRPAMPSVDGLLTPDQIYESTDQTLFVRLSEDMRFERKGSKIQPAGLAPCLSAFGNGPSVDGGVVAVGIHNKTKEIEGCKSLSDDRLQALEGFGQTYCPLGKYSIRRQRVINSRGEEDFIIIYRMYYVPHRLVEMTNSDAYQRFGDKSIQLNDQRKHEIRIDKGERSFEQEPCSLAYPDDFRLSDIRFFCQLVRERRNSSEQVSEEAILEARAVSDLVEPAGDWGIHSRLKVCESGVGSSIGRVGRMPAPYSEDLRDRLTAAVAEGSSARAAAVRFRVSESTAIRWAQRWRAEGEARARPMGGDRRSRLTGPREGVLTLVAHQPDLTLAEIRAELAARHGIAVGQTTIWRFFERHRITLNKKSARCRAGAI